MFWGVGWLVGLVWFDFFFPPRKYQEFFLGYEPPSVPVNEVVSLTSLSFRFGSLDRETRQKNLQHFRTYKVSLKIIWERLV